MKLEQHSKPQRCCWPPVRILRIIILNNYWKHIHFKQLSQYWVNWGKLMEMHWLSGMMFIYVHHVHISVSEGKFVLSQLPQSTLTNVSMYIHVIQKLPWMDVNGCAKFGCAIHIHLLFSPGSVPSPSARLLNASMKRMTTGKSAPTLALKSKVKALSSIARGPTPC